MNQDWILQRNETRRFFSKSTWVPLRASCDDEYGDIQSVGYVSEFFGCGSVAFPPEHRAIAEELSWGEIGVIHDVEPYAYKDGYYLSIEQYQCCDKQPIGINLVFEHPQPVIDRKVWILNPDLIVALRLIKEGKDWVRPEENFVVVAREVFDDKGNHRLIEIKREFLMDYLAARNLSLRLSYYRQRVENVATLENSAYAGITSLNEQRDGGQFELLIRSLDDVYGGSWASCRVWRTDVDEDEDAPVMGAESGENTDSESFQGYQSGYDGIRVEGEFWRDEWIEHHGSSKRVRGDVDNSRPQFIVETDGTCMRSADLCREDIGRWLWFHPSVVNEFLGLRGFSLDWSTSETGRIRSTSGYATRFGVNSADFVTVYAYDIARLATWEQRIWVAHNVVPDGKVSSELFAAQVKTKPAHTYAAEDLLFKAMKMLENEFFKEFNVSLYTHEIDNTEVMRRISRFMSKDQETLLRLAKELIRVFSDRLNVRELRKLAIHKDREKLGSNKLLQDILTQRVGAEKAHSVFTTIIGVYDMRLGDAHPTSSKISEALKLAGIDETHSFLKQGEQLISNFGQSIWHIGKLLFSQSESS